MHNQLRYMERKARIARDLAGRLERASEKYLVGQSAIVRKAIRWRLRTTGEGVACNPAPIPATRGGKVITVFLHGDLLQWFDCIEGPMFAGVLAAYLDEFATTDPGRRRFSVEVRREMMLAAEMGVVFCKEIT